MAANPNCSHEQEQEHGNYPAGFFTNPASATCPKGVYFAVFCNGMNAIQVNELGCFRLSASHFCPGGSCCHSQVHNDAAFKGFRRAIDLSEQAQEDQRRSVIASSFTVNVVHFGGNQGNAQHALLIDPIPNTDIHGVVDYLHFNELWDYAHLLGFGG
jgi:hypothetical protein